MCGIVGYVGWREPSSVLIDGLRRLEYRGYDSCGIAILDNGIPKLLRATGQIANLEGLLPKNGSSSHEIRCGIGHTRWATHGQPTENNAHPHRDCRGEFLVAHNGIIENYVQLREMLMDHGHRFETETDTEVLPHLVESYFRGDLLAAVRAALARVEGVYALAVVSQCDSKKIIVARNGPPIVLGLGQGENFAASDVFALLPFTRSVLFLNDGETAIVGPDSIELQDRSGSRIDRAPESITWSADMAQKEGYAHYMLKEIFEQPRSIRNTLMGRVSANHELTLEAELGSPDIFSDCERIYLVGCGTSLHAAMVGRSGA